MGLFGKKEEEPAQYCAKCDKALRGDDVYECYECQKIFCDEHLDEDGYCSACAKKAEAEKTFCVRISDAQGDVYDYFSGSKKEKADSEYQKLLDQAKSGSQIIELKTHKCFFFASNIVRIRVVDEEEDETVEEEYE